MAKRGRKPTLPREHLDKYGGSPILQVRLKPEIWEWARENGGSAWVRQIVTQLRERGQVSIKDRDTFVQEVEKMVIGAIRDTKNSHGGELLPGSLAKRISTQLWAAWSAPKPPPQEPFPEEPAALLGHLKDRGVKFWLHEGEHLRFEGPEEVLTAPVRKVLREKKAEVVALLAGENSGGSFGGS
jgi:hypothetical protein